MFICLCGIAGCGKSTWARNYINNHNAVIVSTDSIRKIEYGDESIQGGKKIFDIAYERIDMWLSRGVDVIFDATNTTVASRRALLDIARKYNVYTMCYWFSPDVDQSITNQTHRKRQVPVDVIKRQAAKFTTPSFSEGWDFIKKVN